jgi:hypothetical protein
VEVDVLVVASLVGTVGMSASVVITLAVVCTVGMKGTAGAVGMSSRIFLVLLEGSASYVVVVSDKNSSSNLGTDWVTKNP